MAVTSTKLQDDLRRRGSLQAHTVYECPRCDERFLGERRCAACNCFCRSLGLGGACPDDDTIILVAELLDLEVLP
jgi:hypothetical protein